MPTKRRGIVPEGMPEWTRGGHALRGRGLLRRRWPVLLVTAAILAAGALVVARIEPPAERFAGEGRAADGDSLRIGADRIRLIGLDAPELEQVCWRENGFEWPCGRAARDHLAVHLSHGKTVCATAGVDKFGRFLATCENAFGEDIGASLVVNGFAVARDGYGVEEASARADKRGLWNGRFTDPRSWRDEGPAGDPNVGLFEQFLNWLGELTGARTLR
jgi:endonuclease YncB( thermonuclease family)